MSSTFQLRTSPVLLPGRLLKKVKPMTQLQQILQIIEHLGKATPGDISQEMRLTRRDVEKRIYKLVNLGKIKVISKAGHNINGNASNVYCIKEVELDIKQGELF